MTGTPDVAAVVRAELARRRKSHQELQQRLGISRMTMYRRMTGESQFDAQELVVVVADFLGIGVGDLFNQPASA